MPKSQKPEESLQTCTSANLHCGASLDELKAKIGAELAEIQHLEKESKWRALRIGILLIMAKEKLEHGQFLPWMAKELPAYGQRWLYYFIQVGESFLRQGRLLSAEAEPLLLTDGHEHTQPAGKLEQQAFAFLGEGNLEDLFRRLHIRAPRGGGRGGAGREPMAPDALAAAEREREVTQWSALVGELRRKTENGSWSVLPTAILEEVVGHLGDCREKMRLALAAKKRK